MGFRALALVSLRQEAREPLAAGAVNMVLVIDL